MHGKHGQRKHLDRRESPSDELLMVLMHLRTGMHLKDLAFRFGFKSVSHVSVLFQQWIFMLSKVLGSLITWPSCRNVKQNLPNGFKEKAEFRAIQCILDCTEFAIQAPSALSLNAMSYSDYKCCHTVKVLCSITPDGYFSFVSTAFPLVNF